jgi:hypothetical protein
MCIPWTLLTRFRYNEFTDAAFAHHLGAYVVVLRELCTILASYIMEQLVLRARFSEWGALLLYQEVTLRTLARTCCVSVKIVWTCSTSQVISVTEYAEALVDHLDPENIQTVKATFASLSLALKLLTLDAPADIRRYALNKALLSEEQVRAVLSRRAEFSADAVAKVKLNMVDMGPAPLR